MFEWMLAGTAGDLVLGERALLKVDASHPDVGVQLGNTVQLFRVCSPTLQQRLQDTFVRGSELIADYCSDEDTPYHLRLYWEATPWGSGLRIDFSAVVRTPSWVCTPQLEVVTTFAEAQVALSQPTSAGELEWIDPTATHAAAAEQASGPSVLTLADGLQLVQMVYPSDFGSMALHRGEVRFSLLGEPLEKGVIRTTRIRGLLCPPVEPNQLTKVWHDFIAEPLPLTP